MEPNLPTPAGGPGPEAGPTLPSVESIPINEVGIEAAPAPASQEVEKQSVESANQNQGMVQPVQTPVVADPQDDSAQDDTTKVAVVQLNAPDLANDVDVIEKAWVDKAKQIVKETAGDPHQQNHNVSLLRADYMKKRYGKEVKVPDENESKS